METVRVELGKRSYDIHIGDNILENISSLVNKHYQKIAIITNKTVAPLYLEKLIFGLKKCGTEIYSFEIDDGESYKKIETIIPIYDFLLENNLDRSSLIVSLGGGVICDMTGYIAATFMRGLDFIQVPTTLLSQVDASVGGKVAVNHKNAKNLIGAFYQPKMVFIDISVLETLSDNEFKSGMAEVIKHGIILDKDYFDFINENSENILSRDKNTLLKMVKRSVEIKAAIVSEDEDEKGLRAVLNYGHTFGHVVESLTKYRVYSHGEAVIFGMVFACRLAANLGIAEENVIREHSKIFSAFGIDDVIPKYNIDRVIEILKHDKKVKNGKLIFVLPEKIGKVRIEAVDESEITAYYTSLVGKTIKGVIDIGTNTTRLFIAELYNGNISRKYLKDMEITRLGEKVDKNKFLLDEAISRTVDCLKRFSDIANDYGVKELSAAATSASRDATNGNAFLQSAREKAGLNISIIDGEREGTLAFGGVLTEKYDGDIVVIDIGGGSTEFILGNKMEGIKFIKSLNIGSVRVGEKFFSEEKYDSNREEAENWIIEQLKNISLLRDENFTLIGVAGTVTTQVSVCKKLKKYDSSIVHGSILTYDEISDNYLLFKSKNVEERKKIIGLHPKRADVITSGTMLLLTIMKYLKKNSILVSENDILEGLMISNVI